MRKLITILIIITLAGVILPAVAGAYEGLVPCGQGNATSYTATSLPKDPTQNDNVNELLPCQLCHIFIMFGSIVNFIMTKVVPSVAVLMLVMGGITLVFSYGGVPGVGASSDQLSTAKEIITSALLGLLIIYGAWILVNLFLTVVGVETWTGLQTWFELSVSCP